MPGQQQQQQTDSQAPPSSGYHSGIPSPPNDHDIGPRVHFSGSESGKGFFYFLLDCRFLVQSEIFFCC